MNKLNLFEKRRQKLFAYFQKMHSLPSYAELADIFGVRSKGSVHKYLSQFIENDFIRKSDNGKLIPTSKLFGLRVLGDVQAGFPTPAEEELADTMSLDEWLVHNPTSTYMLRVSGDSMIDAGIVEGDLLIVDRGKNAKSGDIIIAEVDNDWTVKYLIKRGVTMFLRAANKHYPDIHPKQSLKIAGVVTSVVRKYL